MRSIITVGISYWGQSVATFRSSKPLGQGP